MIEMMFEINCPNTMAQTKGIGADNMTCIIIEFNKDYLNSISQVPQTDSTDAAKAEE